eukprot:TRINITY_DN64770_c0_g1_i1.p1 TRINITY_DN64770_c0_g1~~TRINITY_DN64770_c0_g1_i1.p1  ORF type:complete len:209 (-),score=12.43 TRINITY_DN64770_c0_g1_i1:227-853(-)
MWKWRSLEPGMSQGWGRQLVNQRKDAGELQYQCLSWGGSSLNVADCDIEDPRQYFHFCAACESGWYTHGCDIDQVNSTNIGNCTKCDDAPKCASGQYRKGCGGSSAGTCMTCPKCAPGYFRDECSGQSEGQCQPAPNTTTTIMTTIITATNTMTSTTSTSSTATRPEERRSCPKCKPESCVGTDAQWSSHNDFRLQWGLMCLFVLPTF